MNTLWVSVLALVAIALVIVLIVNHYQSRQSRARLARPMHDAGTERTSGSPGTLDAAVALRAPSPPAEGRSGRIEPTFGTKPPQPGTGLEALAPASPDDPHGLQERQVTDDGPDTQDGAVPAHDELDERDDEPESDLSGGIASVAMPEEAGLRPSLDPRLDAIVDMDALNTVAGNRLVTLSGTLRRAGSKPLLVEADAGDGRWSPPHRGGAYLRIRVGVLLANRHGPLNAMEFGEFTNAVQALARHAGVEATAPSMQSVLERARALDVACVDLDAQIGLSIETPGALSPAELAGIGAHLGLVERGNIRFAALGSAGEVLFSLALGDRPNLLTLLLDVPRAPEREEPWPKMLACARQCAAFTRGRLVDDAGRPLTDPATSAVMRDLRQQYRLLEDAGLTAGSPAALRVFN
jgi:hypothetical protein